MEQDATMPTIAVGISPPVPPMPTSTRRNPAVWTRVLMKKETRRQLRSRGLKGETYDDIVGKLLTFYGQYHQG